MIKRMPKFGYSNVLQFIRKFLPVEFHVLDRVVICLKHIRDLFLCS